MPIYEYRCSSCGHELEALQKFSDAPLVTCPSCHAETLVKQLSAAGFQLKGSGWYATDFKSRGAKPAKPEGAAAPDASTGKEAAAKGDSTGESAGAAKSETKSDAKTESSSSASAPAPKTGATPAAT
jgi:putative FmdB family regulatory protein